MKSEGRTSLNVSLPGSLRAFVEEQARIGGYGTVSEYVRHLLREAQKRSVEEQLEKLLLTGIESGAPVEADDAFWEDVEGKTERRRPRSPVR